MKTVVTGGTGFIGSHLIKGLLEQNREVIVASDFSRLGSENLGALGIGPSDVEFREADLTDYLQALKAVKGAESVFHLAARVGSLEYLHGSELAEFAALQTNLIIDANVFKACLEIGVKKLIYASSCAVYPMDKQYSPGAIFSEDDLRLTPSFGPTHMTHEMINPDGGYGWSKLVGELQLNWVNSMDIGIARIFNIYGINEPIDEKAHAIGDLIRKVILYSSGEFKVRGDGKQTRDYLYVSDCVEALVKLEKKASSPPVTVNIGSGQAMSIGALAEKILKISGKKFNMVFDLTKPVGPVSRTADISRARVLLGWEPKISLDEGLRRTYDWVEGRLRRK